MTLFDKIVNWNEERGLLDKGFNHFNEFNILNEEVDEFKESTTDDQRVDALCDIIVVAVGSLRKLGYEPDVALEETVKEISSRVGSINWATGKWEKDLSTQAKAKWYKADYSKAKLNFDS